jgi:hypothetical protein
MSLVLAFVAAYAMVFFLGLQSKNVNQSRYLAAALTSIGILGSQFIFTKIAVVAGMTEFLVLAAGSAAGITSSIWVHDHLTKQKEYLNEIGRRFRDR